MIDRGASLIAVEIKSGQTLSGQFFSALERFGERFTASGGGAALEKVLVYGGDESQKRRQVEVLPWSRVGEFAWA